MAPVPAAAILFECRNRETSHLQLISDQEYDVGLALLERDLAIDPDRIMNPGLILGELVARKARR